MYFQASFAAHQSDTKAHSWLRVAPFMDAEYLLVEFIIVHRLPSPKLTGGNYATVGCFKDDINIQIDAWATILFVVAFVVSLCMLCIVSSHIDCRSVGDMKQSRTWKDKIAV